MRGSSSTGGVFAPVFTVVCGVLGQVYCLDVGGAAASME